MRIPIRRGRSRSATAWSCWRRRCKESRAQSLAGAARKRGGRRFACGALVRAPRLFLAAERTQRLAQVERPNRLRAGLALALAERLLQDGYRVGRMTGGQVRGSNRAQDVAHLRIRPAFGAGERRASELEGALRLAQVR